MFVRAFHGRSGVEWTIAVNQVSDLVDLHVGPIVCVKSAETHGKVAALNPI